MKKLRITLLLLGFAVALMSGSTPTAHAAPTSSFDPTRIIDDGVFYNSSSMTASQIQAFLNSKVPACDTNGTQPFAGTTRAQYGAAHGYPAPYTCLKDYYENPTTHANNLSGSPIPSGAQSAAQIISTAASYYGINPQVLIVLLQKEQGLVTDDWPAPYQYKTATGYGCPDTAPCDTQYFGFYNQVNWAAKQFRNYANYPNSFNYLPGPGNYVRYNPSASCGGTTLNIQNQATASLYDYTPYQPNAAALAAGYGNGDSCSAYGNRNFWLYFNDWFGSTLFPQPLGGSLLYQSSTGKIYLTTDSTRYYVPSWDLLSDYGLDSYPFQSVSDATIQQYSDGGTLTNLIYDSGGVYLVNNRTRLHVSGGMCTAWGFSCYDSSIVKSLGATFQTQYLLQGGELTQLMMSNGVMYEASNGQKQPIANPQTLHDLSLDSTGYINASSFNVNSLPLGPLLMTTQGIVAFGPNPTVYYYDGSSYYAVDSMDSYNDWGFGNITHLSVPLSSYNTTPPTSIMLTPWYKDTSNNEYVIDQGRKVLIPSDMANAWHSVTFNAAPSSLVSKLQQSTMNKNVYADGVYQIYNGQKHHVPTWASYLALGISDASTTNIRAAKLAPLPTGNDALGDGTLLALQSDSQKIYVLNNGKTTWIPDLSTYSAYGFSWSGILSYPDTILNDYPLAASPLSSGTINGNYYVVGAGSMYVIPGSAASNFGVVSNQFQSISNQLANSSHPTPLSRFMYNRDTGRIYYASGGGIHYVGSYSAFVAYGGTHSQISAISNADMPLFTEEQAVY